MPPPPPPPPPLPGYGSGPPPPPPPGGPSQTSGFKIVPALGDALHEMKRRISGVEETPACAEGTASEQNRTTSTPTGTSRPKSWHGSQVPGKPPRNNAMLSEMQSKLQKRRDKVDKEAYVVETPESALLPPPAPKPKNSYSTDASRKTSTPLRGWTPPADYGPRRTSRDSGRDSWTPTSDYGSERRVSVDYSHYRQVSVDLERKEELCLAKAVRKSSVKMLGRGSPSIFEPNVEQTTVIQTSHETTPVPANVPPPSSVVLRYWNQCSSSDDTNDNDLNNDNDKNGQSDEPLWKTDAIEGDETQFPSIKNKIANMEEEAKLKLFEVPDVKSKMRKGAPAPGWMEARSKLQSQLDTLINKTSAKITKFGDVNAVEKKTFVKESSSEKFCDANSEKEESPKPRKLAINGNIKSLIKSVANEIQKSFSAKNITTMDTEEDDDEDDEEDDDTNDKNNNLDNRVDDTKADRGEYWRNLTAAIRSHPQNIDMEAPIDFDCKEEAIEDVKEEIEQDHLQSAQNTSLEEPVGFDSIPIVLDASAARSKATLMRKSCTERRLPASVLAKKKAAEKLRDILTTKAESSSGSNQPKVIEQIQKELIDASFQVDMSNTEYDLENLDDDEKADLIAKQISKMDSSYVMKLLKKIEKGILDISIPMLMPFLSLQVKLKMGTNIFKGLESHNKKKMVKEDFIHDMIDDITDIALLQEVIDRTQEKLNILNPPKELEQEIIYKEIDNYFNLEEDSFELPSGPQGARYTSPIKEESTGNWDDHLSKLTSMTQKKEKSPETPVLEDLTEKTTQSEKEEISNIDPKKSDDEGCPSSEFDSSSEEDKEESKDLDSSSDEEKHVAKDFEEVKPTVKEKVEEDEGIGKESETKKTETEQETKKRETEIETKKTETDSAEGKEKNIKQSILKIIENSKSIDQKRAVRNFGRTFEFQNVQLKPTLPNDRRPAKAKRMDNLWNQTLAKKQGVQINHLPTTPKPKVPWTMKKNPQPEKKVEDKEADEFDKCRDTLKNATATGITTPTAGKDIKTIQKMTTAVSKTKKNETSSEKQEAKEIPKVELENVDDEKVSVVTKENTNEDEICKENTTPENTPLTKDTGSTKADVESRETSVATEVKEISKEVSVKELECVETSSTKVSKDERDIIKEVILNAESLIEKKAAFQTDVKKHTEDKNTKILSSKSSSGYISSSSKDELVPSAEVKTTKEQAVTEKIETVKPKDTILDEPKQEEQEVPSTPIVRRRGDTFTVILPPPKCKPPPPPMSRPPPPPMSPPVPEFKVKDLELENKLIIEIKNKDSESESESEEEEESEWEESEWEEESEEEESECEVKKEGWENIMSTSKGPTTFKAEYSVKI